jgi:Ca-activated chloride channel homolog
MFRTSFMAVRGTAAAAEGAQRTEIGCTCGFDSGIVLDHVYGNEAEGRLLIDRLNLNAPGKFRPAARASRCVNEHVPVDHVLSRAAFSFPRLPPFVAQLIAFVAVALATLFAPAGARAEGKVTGLPVMASLAQVRAGSLLLRDGERYVEAPRVATDIDITVSGPTSRARVTQIFDNPTKEWVEAVYVNPLPDGGAVDTLKMVIGDRFVIGDIKERGEAKAIYEDARRTGRKATLFEQERPNIFTNSVANIGPGERVVVQIEYQEPVHRSGNTSSLRVPLVVAPRYNPAPVVQTVDFNDGGGWGRATNDPVPDRDRITPPVLDPRVTPPTNPVAITVHLNAGFPLGEVKSHHHAVNVEAPAADARVIRLDTKVTPADRDFELTWTPAATDGPSVGLFREHVGNADYMLALVTPPAVADAQKESPPREIVFVIDNSGSMGGTSIVQAKASLLFALGRLNPSDRFNVIRFDHTMEALFTDTVAADADNIARATQFVSAIQANGGTEMVPPMKAALTDRRGETSPYLRQVVFLTDGEIGNEQELFDTIAAMRGRSRVFMVGIGSAPNSFLMTRAAEIGRGTYTHIGSVDQVQERMRELTEKLESPAVTGLSARYSAGAMDATPDPLPDLYRGEPVVIAARIGAPDGVLEIKGMIGDRPWTVTLPVAKAADGAGLSKLWARRKITDVEMARRRDRSMAAEADKRILALALEHHLVSRLTSLIAVDATPSRPEGARLTRAELPLNLPVGWDFDKVFGDARKSADGPARSPVDQTRERRANNEAMPDRRTAMPAIPVSGAAPAPSWTAAPPPSRAPCQGVTLPRAATDSELKLTAGLLLMGLSLILIVLNLRRRIAA